MRHVTGLCLVSLLLSGCSGDDAFRRDIADSFRRIADVVEQEIRNPDGTPPPPVNPTPPTSAEIEAELDDLIEQANSNISSFDGIEAVHCLSLACMESGNIYVRDYALTVDTSGFVFTRTRRGVSLAEKESQRQTGTLTESYHYLGGWMEHNFFHIEISGQTFGGYYDVNSVGDATGTNPAAPATGSATWSGTMAGVVELAGATLGGHDDALVDGDASVTFPGLDGDISPTVDVLFSNIVHRGTGGRLVDISWNGVAMTDGAFGYPEVIAPVVASDTDIRSKAISNGIYGRFYGTAHEEVGGVFSYRGDDGAIILPTFPYGIEFTGTGMVPDAIVAAFGAKRDE